MAGRAKRRRRLWDAYCFPGFRPQPTVCGVFGDPIARVIRLTRRSKKRLVAVAVASRWAGTIARCGVCAICHVATRGFFWNWRRSEEHTSELQSRFDLVCRLLLEKKK